MNSFKTKAGTELPLLDLQGKEYLQVAYRLVWFREERPLWSINTEFVQISDNHAITKATIKDENGRTISTAHKVETANGYSDFVEKSETGAIGRALALCGYGTQFTSELEDTERLADAPVVKRKPLVAVKSEPVNTSKENQNNLGNYVVKYGHKYLGRIISDIPKDELESYIRFIYNIENLTTSGKELIAIGSEYLGIYEDLKKT